MSTCFREKVDISGGAYYTDNKYQCFQEEMSWTIRLKCIRKWC